MARSKLSLLILCLLLVLIVTPLVAHYYLSNIGGGSPPIFRSRSQLDHPEDLDNLKSSDLKGQIEELRGIKASVNNELRDLESKRQGLLSEIANLKTQVEKLRMTQEETEQQIQQSKLSLDQLKLEQNELANRFMPIMRAPEKINLSNNVLVRNTPPTSPQLCQMISCFDYSKCSLISGFPVYVYSMDDYLSQNTLSDFIKTSVLSTLKRSPYVTSDPSTACVFVVLLGESSAKLLSSDIEDSLRKLPNWNGDGQNHLILNVARSVTNFDMFQDVNTGRAMVAQSSFVETKFRTKFDIVIPPSLGKSDGPVWEELPPLSPIRRKYFLSFVGQFNDKLQNVPSNNGYNNEEAVEIKLNNFNSDQNFKSRQLKAPIHGEITKLLDLESAVVQNLKRIETDTKENVFLRFVCDNYVGYGLNGEWMLCGSDTERSEILIRSTFSILISPANVSLSSTTIFQTRLFESLKHGAVPVILEDSVELPFSELIDWSKAVLILPKPRVSELHFFLRTFTDSDVMELKRHGRIVWETYFGTTQSIISTLLAVLRTRLQIPAAPVREEPSPSIVSDYSPAPVFVAQDPEEETNEVLGPLEPPFPSLSFKQNYTAQTLKDSFNHPGDPFHLYPFTPFQPVLPSDAKFIGSSYGFRPINKGEGGSGKEFSEALGGNHPREQFTVVMLTYEREQVLVMAVSRLKGLPYLNKVVVVWNNPLPPSDTMVWPDIGVPVHVVKMKKNSLNNRFLPFEAIETEAVLSIDDDAHLRHDEIVFGFRVWREERDRVVGFPGRYHAWDINHTSWLYNSNYSCEMSMVLTGAAFFHKYYAYLYSYVMPEAIRDKVDEYVNCEDIAMNFLVSHITRKPPVKVTSRWTFRCPGCADNLSTDKSHFEERHKCINFFVRIYGYMPLLYTQYRVDSILFKTRISHDKQKCFKFI